MANPIMVVLEDGETWGANGFVHILKDNDAYPDGDADETEDKNIVMTISIEVLLEAYNKVHGTRY